MTDEPRPPAPVGSKHEFSFVLVNLAALEKEASRKANEACSGSQSGLLFEKALSYRDELEKLISESVWLGRRRNRTAQDALNTLALLREQLEVLDDGSVCIHRFGHHNALHTLEALLGALGGDA